MPPWRWATRAGLRTCRRWPKALGHADPTVRGHAAWALGRIGGAEARLALLSARVAEADAETLAEIEQALTGGPGELLAKEGPE